jgi:hypothetical protein
VLAGGQSVDLGLLLADHVEEAVLLSSVGTFLQDVWVLGPGYAPLAPPVRTPAPDAARPGWVRAHGVGCAGTALYYEPKGSVASRRALGHLGR